MDFLRGVAIVLVIFRHSELSNFITRFGWLGVDLFFVLSGFLVSGLLFKEYLKSGKVRVGRFLIRRGFKIYPPFYIFVLFSVAVYYWQTHSFYKPSEILPEIFYLQTYLPHIWDHTWSLAVEEHFYLALALLIPLGIATHRLEKRPFMILFFIAVLALTFCMRFYVSYPHRHDDFFPFGATHLRMDGIVVGVFCSYLYYFTNFFSFFLQWKMFFIAIAAVLILPGFIYEGGSFFMNTIGLSTVNFGFGILLLFSLQERKPNSLFQQPALAFPIKVVGFIGVHSYSIYLWHLVAKNIVMHFPLGEKTSFALYFLLALVLGIALSYIIERPFLKLRDRFFS